MRHQQEQTKCKYNADIFFRIETKRPRERERDRCIHMHTVTLLFMINATDFRISNVVQLDFEHNKNDKIKQNKIRKWLIERKNKREEKRNRKEVDTNGYK